MQSVNEKSASPMNCAPQEAVPVLLLPVGNLRVNLLWGCMLSTVWQVEYHVPHCRAGLCDN